MSSTHLPLYAQVENVIMDRIANGSLPAGSRLPSEDSLVQEYAVSRTTIRAAIQSLVQRGLVEIRRGKGTFVTQPKMTQELTELTGFVEDMLALGRQPDLLQIGASIMQRARYTIHGRGPCRSSRADQTGL